MRSPQHHFYCGRSGWLNSERLPGPWHTSFDPNMTTVKDNAARNGVLLWAELAEKNMKVIQRREWLWLA